MAFGAKNIASLRKKALEETRRQQLIQKRHQEQKAKRQRDRLLHELRNYQSELRKKELEIKGFREIITTLDQEMKQDRSTLEHSKKSVSSTQKETAEEKRELGKITHELQEITQKEHSLAETLKKEERQFKKEVTSVATESSEHAEEEKEITELKAHERAAQSAIQKLTQTVADLKHDVNEKELLLQKTEAALEKTHQLVTGKVHTRGKDSHTRVALRAKLISIQQDITLMKRELAQKEKLLHDTQAHIDKLPKSLGSDADIGTTKIDEMRIRTQSQKLKRDLAKTRQNLDQAIWTMRKTQKDLEHTMRELAHHYQSDRQVQRDLQKDTKDKQRLEHLMEQYKTELQALTTKRAALLKKQANLGDHLQKDTQAVRNEQNTLTRRTSARRVAARRKQEAERRLKQAELEQGTVRKQIDRIGREAQSLINSL